MTLLAADSPAAQWTPPPRDHVVSRWDWRDLGRTLAKYEIVTPVTTSEDLSDWTSDLSYAMHDARDGYYAFKSDRLDIVWSVRDAVVAVHAGLAPADLALMAPLLADGASSAQFDDLLDALISLSTYSFHDETVRDTVGWIVGCWAAGDRSLRAAEDRWAQWYEEDLVKGNWVFLAAGLSPAETAAGLADGSLSPGPARAMAALRGVTLPA